MSDEVEKVDHVAEAHLAVAQAGQYFGEEEDTPAHAAAGIAQAHAQIAIAEQLERLNRQLSSSAWTLRSFSVPSER